MCNSSRYVDLIDWCLPSIDHCFMLRTSYITIKITWVKKWHRRHKLRFTFGVGVTECERQTNFCVVCSSSIRVLIAPLVSSNSSYCHGLLYIFIFERYSFQMIYVTKSSFSSIWTFHHISGFSFNVILLWEIHFLQTNER